MELTDTERAVMRGLRLGLSLAVTQPGVRRQLHQVLRHALGRDTARALTQALAAHARVTVREELGRFLLVAELPDGRRYRRGITPDEAEAIDVAFVDADGEHTPGGF